MGNTVISGILFQPPSPPNALRFLEDDLLNKMKEATTKNKNQSKLSETKYKNISVNHIWLYSQKSREGNEWNLIPAIHITHDNDMVPSTSSPSTPNSTSQKYTLLYSHGNAEDIGLITTFMIDMARLLQVNILCYDYSGYGMSVDTEYACQFFMDYGRELEFWKKYRSCCTSASTMLDQQYGEIPARNGHVCRYSGDVFVAPMVRPRSEMMTGGIDLYSLMMKTGDEEEDNNAYGFTDTCSCNDDTTSGHNASPTTVATAAATTTSSSSPILPFAGNNGNNPSQNVVAMSTEEYTQHIQKEKCRFQQQLLSRHSWTMPIPSDTNCYANIQCAYDYLTKVERSCPPHHVILYGKSVGSGPTCWLSQKLCGGSSEEAGICDSMVCNAETRDPVESGRNDGSKVVETVNTAPRLAGMVLHSPFLSVIRVVLDVGFTPIGDLFPNIDRVGDFKCPVYVIHGSHDAIVPFYHGQTLFESLPDTSKVVPFWAHGAGHNNIEMDMPTAYIKRLHQFIRQCDKLIYPKGSSSRSSRSQLLTTSNSSSGGSADEQTRQIKQQTMHLKSQAPSMSSRMVHHGDATNTTQTGKQRKQKGTLVMRPFHNQIRAPPRPPPMDRQWLNQASVSDRMVEPVVGNWNDNSTMLVLTSTGVHSTPSLPLHQHQPWVHSVPENNINGHAGYHRSSSTPFSIDSSSKLPMQKQHLAIGNHSYAPTSTPMMYSTTRTISTT